MFPDLNIRELYAAGFSRAAALALQNAVSQAAAVANGTIPGQSATEIKTAYESVATAYTTAEQTKLAAIEALATADQTNAEIQTAWEAATSITATTIVLSDGSIAFTAPPALPSYTVAGVPSASPAGRIAYISNESGGATLAFSDATNWRRAWDLAIIT